MPPKGKCPRNGDASSSAHSVPVKPVFIPESNVSSHAERESSRVWTVQALDKEGNQIKIKLPISGVFEMPQDQRIIVEFDPQLRAYGEAAALLSGACKRVATDSKNVPINYESWAKVLKTYKDNCFGILKNLFHFQAPEFVARRYCLLTMGRKYRNYKLQLWSSNYDPSFSRDQLIANVPSGVPIDQWSSFVDYHLRSSYQELCRKNMEARKKQKIPHTGGSKLLSRRQHEMEVEIGHPVSRGELYIATHKKKDGSYVNDEARTIAEKIHQELSQHSNSSEFSTTDALSKVLGPEHSGRVRGLGLGGLPSIAFGCSTHRFNPVGSNFSNNAGAENSQLKEEVASLKESLKTFKTVMLAYIQMKEGHVPLELGALLGTNTPTDEESEEAMPTHCGGSSLDSNLS